MKKAEEITGVGRKELARNDEVFFYNIHKPTTWSKYLFAGIGLTARLFLRQNIPSNVFGLVTILFATVFTFFMLSYPDYTELAFIDFERWGRGITTFKYLLILTVPMLGIIQYLARDTTTQDEFGDSLVFQWAGFESKYSGNYEKVGKAYSLWDGLLFVGLGGLFYTTDILLFLWFVVSAVVMFIEERHFIYYEYTRVLRNKAAGEKKQRRLGLSGTSSASGLGASGQDESGIETRVMEIVSKKEQQQVLKARR